MARLNDATQPAAKPSTPTVWQPVVVLLLQLRIHIHAHCYFCICLDLALHYQLLSESGAMGTVSTTCELRFHCLQEQTAAGMGGIK